MRGVDARGFLDIHELKSVCAATATLRHRRLCALSSLALAVDRFAEAQETNAGL